MFKSNYYLNIRLNIIIYIFTKKINKEKMIFVIIITLFFIWAAYIISFFSHLINKKLIRYKHLDTNLDEKYKPFERFDYNEWNKCEIYFCAVFLLPIRIAIIISSMASIILILNLIVFSTKSKEKEVYPYWKKSIISFIVCKTARLILFCSGVYYISGENQKIADFLPTY